MSEFIQRLTVKNYGCIKDITATLTPLHAFIGPNDGGKSTLLRAVRTLHQLGAAAFDLDKPFHSGIVLSHQPTLEASFSDRMSYGLFVRDGKLFETVKLSNEQALF